MDFIKNYFQTDKCFTPYIIMVVVFIIFMIHAKFLRDKFGDKIAKNDFMNKNISTNIPFVKNISWWPVSHFVIFYIRIYVSILCKRNFNIRYVLGNFQSTLGYL
jgi:hypothetical protein